MFSKGDSTATVSGKIGNFGKFVKTMFFMIFMFSMTWHDRVCPPHTPPHHSQSLEGVGADAGGLREPSPREAGAPYAPADPQNHFWKLEIFRKS